MCGSRTRLCERSLRSLQRVVSVDSEPVHPCCWGARHTSGEFSVCNLYFLLKKRGAAPGSGPTPRISTRDSQKWLQLRLSRSYVQPCHSSWSPSIDRRNCGGEQGFGAYLRSRSFAQRSATRLLLANRCHSQWDGFPERVVGVTLGRAVVHLRAAAFRAFRAGEAHRKWRSQRFSLPSAGTLGRPGGPLSGRAHPCAVRAVAEGPLFAIHLNRPMKNAPQPKCVPRESVQRLNSLVCVAVRRVCNVVHLRRDTNLITGPRKSPMP